jgi:alpha-L-fucosidase
VPERAAQSLRAAGAWIRRYPQVVYGTDASPWQHVLPWGDITVKGNEMFLSVFHWPASGTLRLPGLKTQVISAHLLKGRDAEEIPFHKEGSWTRFELPAHAPESLVSVIRVTLADPPEADPTWGLDPEFETNILAEFAEVTNARLEKQRWMEKFGEWKHVERVHKWTPGGKATWIVDVLEPGEYAVDLTYTGEGRAVWGVTVEGGEHIQNQQNASHNYQRFPIGWINFPKAGRYDVHVSCVEGALDKASLKSIHFTRL